MRKKGQLTIFIILAILIVAIVLGIYFFWDKDEASKVPKDFEALYSSFLLCMEEEIETGVRALETHGGYIYLPEYEAGTLAYPFSSQLEFAGTNIPYWYYVSGSGFQKSQIPTIEEMEDDLEKFIKENIGNCNLDAYYDQGFIVFFGDLENLEVKIKDEEVVLLWDMNFVSEYRDERIAVNDHKVTFDSMLGNLYKDALKVYGYEQQEFFLEKYAIDNLRSYAPVDGVEFTCSPKVWIADNVFHDLEEANEINTMALYASDEEEYFAVDVETENNVRFINSRYWPRSFEVNPTEGNVMIANPVGNQPGLGILGFCYVTYHFVYNMNYPVLVQVYSSDTDEVFQFPLAVVIRGNKEREPLQGSAMPSQEVELCEDMNTPTRVDVFNSQGNPIEANISYNCISQKCNIGETVAGSITELFPQCVNGFVIAKSEGYAEGKIMYSSVDPGQISIFLDKNYEKDIRLSVGGKRHAGEALINFISDDVSKTILYPDQTSVELSEGEYEVHVYVYDKTSLSIPGNTQEYCVDVPRGTILGSFGLTKEECYEVEMSEQDVSSALAGGGKETHPITENQLRSSNFIEISVDALPVPDSLTQLQENYILFEEKGVDLIFR